MEGTYIPCCIGDHSLTVISDHSHSITQSKGVMNIGRLFWDGESDGGR